MPGKANPQKNDKDEIKSRVQDGTREQAELSHRFRVAGAFPQRIDQHVPHLPSTRPVRNPMHLLGQHLLHLSRLLRDSPAKEPAGKSDQQPERNHDRRQARALRPAGPTSHRHRERQQAGTQHNPTEGDQQGVRNAPGHHSERRQGEGNDDDASRIDHRTARRGRPLPPGIRQRRSVIFPAVCHAATDQPKTPAFRTSCTRRPRIERRGAAWAASRFSAVRKGGAPPAGLQET